MHVRPLFLAARAKSKGPVQSADDVYFYIAEEIEHDLAAVTDKPHGGAATGQGVAPRNQWFLDQYEARGTETYHKPIKIKDKWWAMSESERAAICTDSPGKVSHATVKKGIQLARLSRQEPTNPKLRPRKKLNE